MRSSKHRDNTRYTCGIVGKKLSLKQFDNLVTFGNEGEDLQAYLSHLESNNIFPSGELFAVDSMDTRQSNVSTY